MCTELSPGLGTNLTKVSSSASFTSLSIVDMGVDKHSHR